MISVTTVYYNGSSMYGSSAQCAHRGPQKCQLHFTSCTRTTKTHIFLAPVPCSTFSSRKNFLHFRGQYLYPYVVWVQKFCREQFCSKRADKVRWFVGIKLVRNQELIQLKDDTFGQEGVGGGNTARLLLLAFARRAKPQCEWNTSVEPELDRCKPPPMYFMHPGDRLPRQKESTLCVLQIISNLLILKLVHMCLFFNCTFKNPPHLMQYPQHYLPLEFEKFASACNEYNGRWPINRIKLPTFYGFCPIRFHCRYLVIS